MIKTGVDLRGLAPQMAIAYSIAQQIYHEVAGVCCVITSASDGKHLPNSLHYCGKALDLRTNSLRPEQVHPVFVALKDALHPGGFDVVLERDHIHVEFDFKEPEPDRHA